MRRKAFQSGLALLAFILGLSTSIAAGQSLLRADDEDLPPPGSPRGRASDSGRALVGAIYFGGWYRLPLPAHFIRAGQDFKPRGKNVDWRPLFPEREPEVGWFNDTQEVMDEEIRQAAAGGIDFFTFEWFPGRDKAEHNFPGSNERVNNGPMFFASSQYKWKMRYCLEYINAKPFEISTLGEWDRVIDEWIGHFKDPQYLKIGGKPMLIVHSVEMMRNGWKQGEMTTGQAINYLRAKVRRAGIPDVLLGGGVFLPGPNMRGYGHDGYDFLTSFNYPLPWVLETGKKAHRYDEIVALQPRQWASFRQYSPLPYVPVVTSGWDRRAQNNPDAPIAVYFLDRRPEKFRAILDEAKRTVDQWPKLRLPNGQKMVILYAWNELGEGGILIPTKQAGDVYLRQVKDVFGIRTRDVPRSQPAYPRPVQAPPG